MPYVPQANQKQLECLHGPQQIISNVFQAINWPATVFLVRWTPTFMLSPNMLAYCKKGYKACIIHPLKGELNQSCPALRLISWADPWEVRTCIQATRRLDGAVPRIDEEVGTQASKLHGQRQKTYISTTLTDKSFKDRL